VSVSILSIQCTPFDMSKMFGGAFGNAVTEPNHEDCPGGQHTPGVLGGWDCICACHRAKNTTHPSTAPSLVREEKLADA
jgi:hypothetical protein